MTQQVEMSPMAGVSFEKLPNDQEELLRTLGDAVLRVSQGLQAIENIERVISKDSSYLFRFRNGESIEPDQGMLFALKITDKSAVEISRARNVDNGCRSGVSYDQLDHEIVTALPEMFYAKSYQAYAYASQGHMHKGYQFNGPNGVTLTTDSNELTGAPDGVEVGQISIEQAINAVEGGLVTLVNLDEDQTESFMDSMRRELDAYKPRLFES